MSSELRKILLFVATCCAAEVASAQGAEPQETPMRQIDYRSYILQVASANKELFSLEILMADDTFRVLYQHADAHMAASLGLVSDSERPHLEKTIAVASMHGLPADLFPRFLSSLYDLYCRGVISEGLLHVALFPGEGFNSPLRRGLQYPEMVTVMRMMEADQTLSELLRKGVASIRANAEKTSGLDS